MAINFPDSPSINDTHTVNGRTWVWDGSAWKLSGTINNGISLEVSDTAPSTPIEGDMWYNSANGSTYTYYQSVWVELGNTAAVEAFISDDDGDTLVHVEEGTDDDTIRFDTAGVERLTISSSGHVLPSADVSYDLGSASYRFRDLYLSGSSIDLGGVSITSDGTNLALPPISNISGDFTVDTNTLHVDSTNNRVGIGTTTPAEALDVFGTIHIGLPSDTYLLFEDTGTPSESFIRHSSADGSLMLSADQNASLADSGISMRVDGVTRMRLDSSGNLGIGTTTPDTELHISANSGATIRIESTDTSLAENESIGAIEWEAQDISTGSSGVVGKIEYIAEDVSPDYAMTFHTMWNDAGFPNFSERMRIDSEGNVGIGTTNPANRLQVDGDLGISSTGTSTAPTFSITTTSSSAFNHPINAFNPNLTANEGNIIVTGKAGSVKNSGYVGYRHTADGSDSNMVSLGMWGNDWLLNVLANGYVGIGTTAPEEALHVTGKFKMNGDTLMLSGTGNYPNSINWYHPTTGFWHQSGPRLLEGNRMAWYWNNGSTYTEAASLTTDGTLSGVSVGKTDTNRYTYITAWPNDGNWIAVNGGNGYLLLDGNYADGSIYLRSYNAGGLVRIGAGHQNVLNVGSNYVDVTGYLYASDHLNSNGQIRSAGVFNATTPATTQMVHVADANYQYRFWRSTSRRDAKTDIEDITDENALALLDSRPVWFRSAMPHDDPNLSYYGFIAEELAEVDPRMCTWSAGRVLREGEELQEGERACTCENNQEFVHTFDHQPECIQVTGVDYGRLAAHLTKIAQIQQSTIDSQQTQIDTLTARIEALESAP